MNCLDYEQIEAFLAEALSGIERGEISRHLAECEKCRSAVDEAKQNIQVLDRVRHSIPQAGSSHAGRLGNEVFPGYRLIEEIGRGGMGIVYLAEQSNPRRQVALKLILPNLATTEALQRFQLEAQILGKLQHPGIAGVYEAGIRESQIEGRTIEQPYFAMELVQGDRLDQYVRTRQPSIKLRLEILAQICDAVHHAHTRGVVHRDLKPGNIIVEEQTEGTALRIQPKILDFGVARSIQPDLSALTMFTEAGRLLGTLPFMSPEQVSGDVATVDTRSDIYSLGVLGFWLLTGNLPYELQDCSLPEAARIICHDEPTLASIYNDQLPGDADTILRKALEKDPDRRYNSASEFAEDIRRFLRDEPIVARPPSTWYQVSKFARRNRALVYSILALFIVTVAGATLAIILAVRSDRAEQLAQSERQAAIQEAATATAINEFLLKVLSSADPYAEWGGRDITVAEALQIAAAQLDSGRLAGQPETELAVRHTVGNAYRTLGNYSEAERQMERALFAHDSAFGAMDPDAVGTRNDLAAVYAEQGRFKQAEDVVRQNLAVARAAGNLRDETGSLGNLAAFLAEQGHYAEAESTITINVALLREMHGDGHSEIAINLNNLGVLRSRLGQYEGSERVLNEALVMQRELNGERHPLTLDIMHSLGRTILFGGDLARAEEVLRDALARHIDVYGTDHPDVPGVQTSLAVTLMRRGRPQEVDGLLKSALRGSREFCGERHPTTARVFAAIGELRMRENRLLEADAEYGKAESVFRELLGNSNPLVAEVLHDRAMVSLRRQNFDKASEQLVEALQIRRAILGPQSPLTIQTRDSLLSLFDQWDRPMPDSLSAL